MGNKNARVAPAKTLKVLDTQTRTRYKNQRESNNLRAKLQTLSVQHNEALSRLAFDEQDIKMKLHEFQYDKTQRELYKSIDKQRPKSRLSVFNVSHLDNNPSDEKPSLLLHNLYESQERDRSNMSRTKQNNKPNKNKPLSAFEKFQLQYASKADMNRHHLENTDKTIITHTRSLQRETEQMKKAISTAVAKAARDSHMVSRRDAHMY